MASDFNLKEFAMAIVHDLGRQGVEFFKDSGYETMLDSFADAYHKVIMAWSRRYLDYEGVDPAVIKRHRRKFMRVVKMTCGVLSEIDCYITGRYRNIWSAVEKQLAVPIKSARTGSFEDQDDTTEEE